MDGFKRYVEGKKDPDTPIMTANTLPKEPTLAVVSLEFAYTKSGESYYNVISALPFISCKECKHRGEQSCQIQNPLYGLKDDDFCSYGERREQE